MGQLLLHRPEGPFHVLVLGDVQLQQLQAGGAKLGQAASPSAVGTQAACKHCEAPLIQAPGQLEAEATIAPCYQYTKAMAILQGALSTAPHSLDKKQQQQYGDGEAAHSLAQQEGAVHGGGLEDLRFSGMDDCVSTG